VADRVSVKFTPRRQCRRPLDRACCLESWRCLRLGEEDRHPGRIVTAVAAFRHEGECFCRVPNDRAYVPRARARPLPFATERPIGQTDSTPDHASLPSEVDFDGGQIATGEPGLT
jgi:hypothetical protein